MFSDPEWSDLGSSSLSSSVPCGLQPAIWERFSGEHEHRVQAMQSTSALSFEPSLVALCPFRTTLRGSLKAL
eukprot:916254-Amphidinium_carterae.1